MIGRRRFVLSGSLGLVAASTLPAHGAPSVRRGSFRAVERTVRGMPTTDGAGVKLTRVIGQPVLRNLDPFLMLDRFNSDDPGAYIAGFPDHPHRGFETVTVMLDGRMRHRDSVGNSGLIGPGGIQWMTAGRGIVHSEMPEQDRGLMSGFQLWLNLPAREKWRKVEYQDLQAPKIAAGKLNAAGSSVRLVAGELDGLKGPVAPRSTEPLLFTSMLEDDTPVHFTLPEKHTAFVYVFEGEVELGAEGKSTAVGETTLALLGHGRTLRARATNRRSGIYVAAAKPIGEPIVQRGPFVMNTEEEIRQAWEDYRSGALVKG